VTDDAAVRAAPIPPVVSTARLIGASFDLLNRSSAEMRRASFYIGIVALGTVGPFALASWALVVVSLHTRNAHLRSTLDPGAEAWLGVLGSIAVAGLLVAAIESRTMAAALLGGRLVGRPLSVRGSLARSRISFWRVIVGAFIVAVPVTAAQIVMFVGLTRATLGLDTVRPGGDGDPATVRAGPRRFRWLTIGMWIAFATGLLGLGAFLVILAD